MFDLVNQFRKLSRAMLLRLAEAEFSAVVQQERRSFQKGGLQFVHAPERARRALEKLKKAKQAYEDVGGGPKPVGLTEVVRAEIERLFPRDQQQEVSDLM